MKAYDIPMVYWMIVIASILFMLSVGPLLAGAVMLLFDQTLNTGGFMILRVAVTRSCGSTSSGSSTPRGLRGSSASDRDHGRCHGHFL